MDKTREILAGMLTENVGRSLLDSGGIPKYDANGNYVGSEQGYGRAFERNQGRNFEAGPECHLSWRWGLEFSNDVYHWLAERVVYAPEWQEKFDAFAAREGNEREPWLGLMEAFFADLRDSGHEVGGIYGEGEPVTVNTYNHQSTLTQTLQYVYAEVDGEEVILLQIHGGADVRGGYTAPKAFTGHGNHELGILDDARGSICCEDHDGCGGNWSTDDAYHFYEDGSTGGTNLEEYDVVRHGGEHGDITEVTAPLKGIIYVDTDGNGICPLCAKGKLIPRPY